ncbi:DUF456 domain-containing protein [Lysobacter soyae]|uniref:DUF456 domain-containing protein n=1 Tax=Lysobacter soyae TaxID=2764185 RepID=A0ABX8WMJ9_9GAMM|nr:DUF456 domain-containing protein [Lysobacter sp. CJ11]QYR52337.1 DUF456 domain-containing protein [Lysobacter sp. CJ11]
MDMQHLYFAGAAVLILIGIAGTLLPAIPGLPLVFIGLLLAAWANHFERVGAITLVVLAFLTVISLVVDYWASAKGAERTGASRLAVLGAAIGTLATFVLGPIGLFVGPFIGAAIGEIIHRRSLAGGDLGAATKIGVGATLGAIFGIVLKLGIAFLMLGLFALAWFA